MKSRLMSILASTKPRHHWASLVSYVQGGRAPAAAECGRWMFAGLLVAGGAASAQEALRRSLAAAAPSTASRPQEESQPFMVKAGDFRMLASSSLGLDWNDNINSSKVNAQQDFILRPQAQLQTTYPLTQVNIFNLSIG